MLFNLNNRTRYDAFMAAKSGGQKASDIEETPEGDESSSAKLKFAVTMSWAFLIQNASLEESGWQKPSLDKEQPFELEILNVALEKATRNVQTGLSLDRREIRRQILTRLNKAPGAFRTAQAAIKQMRLAEPAWFTECEQCGADNDAPWEICHECGSERDEG